MRSKEIESAVVVVVRNVSHCETITVYYADTLTLNPSFNTIYTNGTSIDISPGKARVFLKVMFNPPTWDVSLDEFIPSIF